MDGANRNIMHLRNSKGRSSCEAYTTSTERVLREPSSKGRLAWLDFGWPSTQALYPQVDPHLAAEYDPILIYTTTYPQSAPEYRSEHRMKMLVTTINLFFFILL